MIHHAPTVALRFLQLVVARRFESFMFTPYARTVVVSERDREELLGINPALNIDVIPNGIDVDYFQVQNVEREPATLLFTGNYEYTPNVDAALRLAYAVLPEVRKVVPSVRLWLVGNAPPPEILALQDSGSGLKPTVLVTGRVPDVRPYLAQATAFVCPLRLGAGIKNKILEALAMGLPVVATPLSVDGIGVQHGESALITDERHMANEVIRLLQDDDLKRKLSESGRVLIEERYRWAQVAALYEDLYRSVQP
jgi:glycosyltransferase involved in cell wall biosynthesis